MTISVQDFYSASRRGMRGYGLGDDAGGNVDYTDPDQVNAAAANGDSYAQSLLVASGGNADNISSGAAANTVTNAANATAGGGGGSGGGILSTIEGLAPGVLKTALPLAQKFLGPKAPPAPPPAPPMSTGAKVALGVGAVALIGGGLYAATKSKKKR